MNMGPSYWAIGLTFLLVALYIVREDGCVWWREFRESRRHKADQ